MYLKIITRIIMYRSLLMIFVGVLIIFFSIWIYINRIPFLLTLHWHIYDMMLRSIATWPKDDSVVIVDIDETSLKEYGQWPWARVRLAELVNKLFNSGTKVVAFDIIFAEEDRLSPKVLEKSLFEILKQNILAKDLPKDITDFDMIFADSISNRNVILGCFLEPSDEIIDSFSKKSEYPFKSSIFIVGKGDPYKFIPHAKNIQEPIPVLSSASYIGFLNSLPDTDNVVRRAPLVWALSRKRLYPSLALEACRLYKGGNLCMLRCNGEGELEYIEIYSEAGRSVRIPVDSYGCIPINFRKYKDKQSAFRVISAAMVNKIDPVVFDGKIVLIGSSAIGLKDIKATSLGEFHIPGVEVHANIIENILSGDILYEPSWLTGVTLCLLLITGTAMTILITYGKAMMSFLLTIAIFLGYIKISQWLMSNRVVYIPSAELFLIVFIYPVLTSIRFWHEELQRRKIRKMFGTMVSESILKYLEEHPESFSLTGQRREATVFFSDIEGFTRIAEQMKVEELARLINIYLTCMTNIIIDYSGCVDKFEGDLIMAEWGLPYPLKDHAIRACEAALKQQDELKVLNVKLKKDFGIELNVRMGINTGEVIAGMMGSINRFEYTVIGDTVNLASRLETVNKDYRTKIIIAEDTFKKLDERFCIRMLDRILVAGKTVPVVIYELIGYRDTIEGYRYDALKMYEDALILHWQRKWQDSLQLLERILRLVPYDYPSEVLKKRIQFYIENEPPHQWEGVWVRNTKD